MSKDLTPAVIERTNNLIDAVLRIALGATAWPGEGMFSDMRHGAEDATAAVTALHELLEIQTQGGGPAAEGYRPADPAAVASAVRAHALAAIAAKTGAVPAPGAPNGFVMFGVPRTGAR
jgi:hypothetical protein